jgi:hypothetical protein
MMSFTPSLLLIWTAGIFTSLQATRPVLATPSDASSSSESVHAVGLGVFRRRPFRPRRRVSSMTHPVECGITRNMCGEWETLKSVHMHFFVVKCGIILVICVMNGGKPSRN